MNYLQLILGTALFLCAGLSAQTMQANPPETPAGGTASAIDGDLILDGNDSAILPEEINRSVPAAASPTAKPAITADTPSVENAAAAPPSAPAAGQPQAEVPAQKVTDEELILDGGEEYLLGKEKPLRTTGALSGSPVEPETIREKFVGTDSGPAAVQAPVTVPLPVSDGFADSAASASTFSVAAVKPPPADAGKEHAINFARNLKEYRSPKLAMLMSLILPGSGQIYARSNLWAAAFGIIEAAVVGTGLALSAKARKVKKQARDFADRHYDTTRVRSYLDSLSQFLPTMFPLDTLAGHKADSIYNEVIFLAGEDSSFFFDAKSGNDSYYGYLDRGASSPFIRGWDDVKPIFTSGGFQCDSTPYGVYGGDTAYLVFLKSDPAGAMYGASASQEHYSGLLRDSRNWSGYSRSTFLSLLINHVASSVMAGIAAKSHNDALLGKESVWRRVGLEQQYVFTGSETAPGYALKVSF
ncbi:MAG: hypothetical protein JW699_03885 [Chitinispirillaceae bacterium]|nr:hypothetical protein [Chitinispirillaceae bacterium]